MTVTSCAGSRSRDALNNKEFGAIIKQATGSPAPAANLPKSLESTPVVAEHGGTLIREINISGNQLLVACVVGFCLAGTLVWSFVRYWLFAP